MKHCIEVKDLTKQYNKVNVVDHVSFQVNEKEVFGLLGHNGAGKSTMIDCMLGLCKPESGTAMVLGVKASEKRKNLFEQVGVQLQQSHYQDVIKVKEICEEISILYKHPVDYHVLLKQFHLDTFSNHKVKDLSGGERQKLSVVLALIPNPKVIFLDELTTGLDVAARHEVWNNLNALKAEGLTIFLTTHYMEEAEKLCDRILILKRGKAVAKGSVQAVIASSPYQSLEEAYLWYMGEEIV